MFSEVLQSFEVSEAIQTNVKNDVVLVFLLLTWNIFYIFF